MMRTSGQLRFYAFAAVLFLLIALSVFFAPSGTLEKPAEFIGKLTGSRPGYSSDEPEPVYDIRPPSSEPEYDIPQPSSEPVYDIQRPTSEVAHHSVTPSITATQAHSSPTSHREFVPPYVGIDEDLPELDKWPGPAENGSYGDWTDGLITEEQHQVSNQNQRQQRLNISSKMTSDGRYIRIDWGQDHEGYNPSILPHPEKADTWIVIGQRDKSQDANQVLSQQLYCEARFTNDTLKCDKSPLTLAIAATASSFCEGEIEWFNANIGPHDARMFHGLHRPYMLYNQQAKYNCIGQWLHDARRLVDYTGTPPQNASEPFFFPVSLQKTGGEYRHIEKNWFPFWDKHGDAYLHYTITPQRRFARLAADGSVGEDLGPVAAEQDNECMSRLMPKLKETGLEWIHQATNALEITLCKRSDPTCEPNDDNTFLMTLFQTKTFYAHGQYEPYFMLFRRVAPFQIHAVSKTPFWYHGRGKAFGDWRLDRTKPKDQAQMVFTTSLSWKKQGQTYSGYLDDEMMMCFGIEDKHGGTMDVTIGDLIADVAYC